MASPLLSDDDEFFDAPALEDGKPTVVVLGSNPNTPARSTSSVSAFVAVSPSRPGSESPSRPASASPPKTLPPGRRETSPVPSPEPSPPVETALVPEPTPEPQEPTPAPPEPTLPEAPPSSATAPTPAAAPSPSPAMLQLDSPPPARTPLGADVSVTNLDTGETMSLADLDVGAAGSSLLGLHTGPPRPTASPASTDTSGGPSPASTARTLPSPARVFRKSSTSAAHSFVKVKSHKKNARELCRLLLCQRLDAHRRAKEAVWCAKFSLDGQYLATGGGNEEQGTVRVWQVVAPSESMPTDASSAHLLALAQAPEGAAPFSGASAGAGQTSGKSGAMMEVSGEPVLSSTPFRVFQGHTSHVVDLAWSRTNLLLSASMDKYVRLWHVSRMECLFKFEHPDCVTSVAFHPLEDTYFLSGCFDKKLRVWGLHSGRVVLWQATTEIVTAVQFSPDARLVVAGLYSGNCVFYLTDGLRYHTMVECRNRKGSTRGGRKVTGLQFANGGTELLVTTNDSRVRLVSMEDFSVSFKYKGLRNDHMQISASFDDFGERIVCGSEDGKVYVWRTKHDQYRPRFSLRYNLYRNASFETFHGTDTKSSAVTVALFARQSTLITCRPPVDGGTDATDPLRMIIVTADAAGTLRVFENLV